MTQVQAQQALQYAKGELTSGQIRIDLKEPTCSIKNVNQARTIRIRLDKGSEPLQFVWRGSDVLYPIHQQFRFQGISYRQFELSR